MLHSPSDPFGGLTHLVLSQDSSSLLALRKKHALALVDLLPYNLT